MNTQKWYGLKINDELLAVQLFNSPPTAVSCFNVNLNPLSYFGTVVEIIEVNVSEGTRILKVSTQGTSAFGADPDVKPGPLTQNDRGWCPN